MADTDGKIIDRDINEEMQTAYISYAMSVIVSRALADVRDGLKPSQRKVLYTMKNPVHFALLVHAVAPNLTTVSWRSPM